MWSSFLSWLAPLTPSFLPGLVGLALSLSFFLSSQAWEGGKKGGREEGEITFGGGDEREFLSFFVASFSLVGSQFLGWEKADLAGIGTGDSWLFGMVV